MAVQYVDQLYSSGIKTQVDDKGWITATASRRLNVFVSTPDDTEAAVLADARIPREKSRHPHFSSLFCSGVSLDRRGPLHFEVTADYQSRPYKDEAGQGPGAQQGPLSQPTQISYFTISNSEEVDEDRHGKPIQTKNAEPINGVTRIISDLGVRLTRNFATFDPASFYTYIDCVNSDTFLGFPPGVLRIANISADEQFYNDNDGNAQPFWAVTVEVNARKPYRTTPEKAWHTRIRHEGYQIRSVSLTSVGALFPVVRASDGNKEPVNLPVPLDESGFRLPLNADAVWLEWDLYEPVNFASMGF